MIRTLGGLAWGIGIAILVMILVEAAGNQLYPPPIGLDLERPDAAFRMPFRTLIFPVLGWFLGPLADPAVRAAVANATFEHLVGFQLTQDQLRYNATR